MPDDSKSWVGLGNIALARRQFEPALEFYLKAYQFNPRSYVALYNLALVYRAMGNIEKAVYYENKARQRQ